ncbi:hypothetical protein H0H81_006711 [Sphagnurus paluster]|uniref:General stress protein FMN-binding split barrel domain-containing protein n=1 Tax=Sphagnurus paluster TaxID=117069 RepID=A0A9P7FUZ7_9AGAR|nr:hypothetical protein H0H81_006711 [Sphagnurus paluster]
MSASKLDPYTANAENNEHNLQERLSAFSETQVTLVFLANNASHKFEEIENDAHVNVNFLNNETTAWASFSGRANISQDKALIKKHWSSHVTAYFGDLKDGTHRGDETDPRISVIEVVPDEIRYWFPTKGVISRAIEAGVGAMTGRASAPGEIRTINQAEANLYVPALRARVVFMDHQAEGPQDKIAADLPSSQFDQDVGGHNALGYTLRITPVYRLSPEILSYIFVIGQALDLEDFADDWERGALLDKYSDSTSPTQPFEVLVTHVCSHFRKVAIGTQVLWSSVTLGATLHKIETYLARSYSCRLSVRVELDNTTPTSTHSKVDLVVPHCHRYQDLVIDTVCGANTLPILRRFCRATTPVLRQLSIGFHEVEDPTIADRDGGVFQGNAPKLSFVRLRGLALHFFRPPLNNVATLHLDQTIPLPMLYTTFRDMVTAPSILRNLSIYGDIIYGVDNDLAWPTNNPIHLPYLRCLRICGIGGSIYSGLLLGITAPALESLVLKDLKEHDLERFWASPIHAFRFPLLRSLTFLDCVSRDVYIKIFHSFPAVSVFTATHQIMADRVLLLLSEPLATDGVIPWPQLHTLSLCVNLSISEPLLFEVVKQRKAVGYPLTKLRLGRRQPLSVLSRYTDLAKEVILETFVEFDGWPNNNPAFNSDPDDILFV